MSFRQRSLPVVREEDEQEKKKTFRERSRPIEKEISEVEKIAATVPAELFGGAIGSIPGLATQTKEFKPIIESLETQARPEYLSSTGLEPATEKGLTNLLALVGQIPGIEKFTPEALREKFRESTQEKFVPQSTLGKGLARGASLAGQAIPFGGSGFSNLAKIAAGGAAGEALRAGGASEGIATAAEISTPGLLSSLGKNFKMSPEKMELAALGKEIGLNDRQLSAVLKSPKMQATFAKFASKGEKAENLVSSIFDKLGDNYQSLKSLGREEGFIPGDYAMDLANDWKKILFDLEQTHGPSPDKIGAMEYIKKAISDLESKGTTPEHLINTFQDINRSVNWNSWSGGKKQLAALKKPIGEILKKSSPEIGKEFQQTNELYKKSIQLAKLLKPTELENLLAHGHAGEMALALATFNPGLLNKYLGFLGGRVLSREMLFSPRFNNMRAKMMQAIKKNDVNLINQTMQKFGEEIKKRFPEESEELDIPEYS